MMEEQRVELTKLQKLLPGSKANLRRLAYLLEADDKPRVAVFGKYNHGKSTLLNSIIGEERFKVADKRETVEVAEFEHDGVMWIDTPGLDADVNGQDDHRAKVAAFEKADILCLVHSCKTGELDRDEMQLYRQLMRQDHNYRSKIVLALTQIDQISPEELAAVEEKIREQLSDMRIAPVSAVRYTRGLAEGKQGFVNASGMNEFKDYLSSLKAEVAALRKKEVKRLLQKARVELKEIMDDRSQALSAAKCDLAEFENAFWKDVEGAKVKLMGRAQALSLI